MFLDEPTSGLDSAMASEVITNLQKLLDETACTLVVSIHQVSISHPPRFAD
jgi:ABC-type multidrug transport system ATPase subunit